ncbi:MULTISPECIES: hypothetical protein [Pseudomonas]|uniref:Uncharacterized protein n=2 Tax=Pseudomonas TaxID=286 RepID=A0A3M3DRK0_9PSED|nr:MULTISPECIES: hypothetical protein [Pseudomonas]KPW98185.1 hypothetical protein ALO79_200361 [Pseudomonas syringae pv. castaneae]RMM39947.1 hypothetical protein ALQ77_04158 [Pseudomonas corrugata]SDV04341.1 DNA phosphorothioation-dependent restriction protein DptG [Pseudomonas corrugata]
MNINSYLSEIEHAARSVIGLLWEEHRQVEELQAQVEKLNVEVHDGYRRAAAWKDSEDPDDVMAEAGIRWETYFGPDKQRNDVTDRLTQAHDQLAARAFSRSSMAASLLQYAKQGISITQSSFDACPDGYAIGTQVLKQVIWQGRNQSTHWEEGKPHKAVTVCFDLLTAEAGGQFAPYKTQNLAFEVVTLLGWDSYEVFEADLRSLA